MPTSVVNRPRSAAVWRERDAELLAPCYARYSDLVVESAQGVELHTVDGRTVLDFGCGIGVTNLGHGHPAVVKAVHEQVDRLWHTSVTTLHPMSIRLAEKLVEVTPDGLDQVFLCNSGAEAVEASIKLARKATGRSEIIAFLGAFHGRTYGALSLTASKAKYRAGVGPLLPGVHHVTYPNHLRECTHAAGERCEISEGDRIEELFRTLVSADSVAAIIVEPVLGEGGYVVPDRIFLRRLREICDDHGILLIADEVQSGIGRTGRWFAVDHFGVVPDIITVAKALGNGVPIAAIVAKHSLMSAWHPGEHGSTYGGNPIACAAALAVLQTIEADGVLDHATAMGARAMERMSGWQTWCRELSDVRGLGLMLGLEFRHAEERMPAPEVVSALRAAALRRDLLVLSCGIDDNVIRVIPPLTITQEELDRGLDVLEESLHEVCA